jgi:hypothetical protein
LNGISRQINGELIPAQTMPYEMIGSMLARFFVLSRIVLGCAQLSWLWTLHVMAVDACTSIITTAL